MQADRQDEIEELGPPERFVPKDEAGMRVPHARGGFGALRIGGQAANVAGIADWDCGYQRILVRNLKKPPDVPAVKSMHLVENEAILHRLQSHLRRRLASHEQMQPIGHEPICGGVYLSRQDKDQDRRGTGPGVRFDEAESRPFDEFRRFLRRHGESPRPFVELRRRPARRFEQFADDRVGDGTIRVDGPGALPAGDQWIDVVFGQARAQHLGGLGSALGRRVGPHSFVIPRRARLPNFQWFG